MTDEIRLKADSMALERARRSCEQVNADDRAISCATCRRTRGDVYTACMSEQHTFACGLTTARKTLESEQRARITKFSRTYKINASEPAKAFLLENQPDVQLSTGGTDEVVYRDESDCAILLAFDAGIAYSKTRRNTARSSAARKGDLNG